MVATVRTTNSVVAMLTSALASRARIGSEGHARAQGGDTEPDLDLVGDGRGDGQQVADEQRAG